jgi:hypothetical protein
METHICKYCQDAVLHDKWTYTSHGVSYRRAIRFDIGYIREAINTGCALFLPLAEKLLKNGHTIESLLP